LFLTTSVSIFDHTFSYTTGAIWHRYYAHIFYRSDFTTFYLQITLPRKIVAVLNRSVLKYICQLINSSGGDFGVVVKFRDRVGIFYGIIRSSDEKATTA